MPRDPLTFGRRPEPKRPNHNVIPLILAGLGALNVIAAIGLTYVDDLAHPAGPFLIGVIGFTLLLSGVLSFNQE